MLTNRSRICKQSDAARRHMAGLSVKNEGMPSVLWVYHGRRCTTLCVWWGEQCYEICVEWHINRRVHTRMSPITFAAVSCMQEYKDMQTLPHTLTFCHLVILQRRAEFIATANYVLLNQCCSCNSAQFGWVVKCILQPQHATFLLFYLSKNASKNIYNCRSWAFCQQRAEKHNKTVWTVIRLQRCEAAMQWISTTVLCIWDQSAVFG